MAKARGGDPVCRFSQGLRTGSMTVDSCSLVFGQACDWKVTDGRLLAHDAVDSDGRNGRSDHYIRRFGLVLFSSLYGELADQLARILMVLSAPLFHLTAPPPAPPAHHNSQSIIASKGILHT